MSSKHTVVRNAVVDIADQIASGVRKSAKAIALAMFWLVGGVGLLQTPAGLLYPVFLGATLTSRPLDHGLLRPVLLCGLCAAGIGGAVAMAKGYGAWIGCLVGVMLGPFWTCALMYALAPRRKGNETGDGSHVRREA